jgi:hypothetical protein
MSSQNFNGTTHSLLDMDSFDVVPSLLQEGSQEVECHDDVLSELFVGHLFVSDSNVQVGDLLELPLDGGLDVIELLDEWLSMGDWSWESTDSCEDWTTKSSWDLLDEGVGGDEHVVLFGPSLDEFLVLVEFLEVIKVGYIKGKTGFSSFIGVFLISNKAELESWSWDVWESDLSNETLVFLWIVVLEGNLELDSLLELSGFGGRSHAGDVLQHFFIGDLA